MLSTRGTHTSANAYAYSRNAPTIRADANGQDSIYVIYDSRPNATDEPALFHAAMNSGILVKPAGIT